MEINDMFLWFLLISVSVQASLSNFDYYHETTVFISLSMREKFIYSYSLSLQSKEYFCGLQDLWNPS